MTNYLIITALYRFICLAYLILCLAIRSRNKMMHLTFYKRIISTQVICKINTLFYEHAIDFILSAAVNQCNLYMAKSEDNEKALREILYVIDDQYTILKTLFKRSDLNIVKQTLSKKMRDNMNQENNEITIQFLSSAVVGVIVWWIEASKPCDIDTLTTELSVLLEPHSKHL
ncbi:TetR/AcrR family transcriptional regulator C-terminal domain-containing protein [Staphylococcus saprophyticus]